MKTFFLCISLSLIILGCDKSESTSFKLAGTYDGFFTRTGMDTSGVIIFFDQNRFEGQSSHTNYPAICRGTFNLDENTVTFVDSCAWTANFDWSLILTGTYNINFSEGTVRIWKTNGAVTDEYRLRKPTR